MKDDCPETDDELYSTIDKKVKKDKITLTQLKYILSWKKQYGDNIHFIGFNFASGGKPKEETKKSDSKQKGQINTQSFKDWFGDSQITSEDGEPLIVYHGSSKDFDSFDPEKSHGMIWLSGNKEYAEDFAGKGNVKSLYAKIENPIDVREMTEEIGLSEWENKLSEMGIDTSNIDWESADWASAYGAYTFFDLLPHAGNNYIDTGFLDAIKQAGYDGILAPPEETEGIKSDYTIVAFDSKQIKSATDNSGSFDPDSDKITNSENKVMIK